MNLHLGSFTTVSFQGSSASEHVSIILHCFLRKNDMPLRASPRFISPFISWWTFGSLLLFDYYECCCCEHSCTCVCVNTHFTSLGCILRKRTAGSCDHSVTVWGIASCFPKHCPTWRSRQYRMRVPISPNSPNPVIVCLFEPCHPGGVRGISLWFWFAFPWCLTVLGIFSCCCWPSVCFLWRTVSTSFAHFKMWLFAFFFPFF